MVPAPHSTPPLQGIDNQRHLLRLWLKHTDGPELPVDRDHPLWSGIDIFGKATKHTAPLEAE